ncbi:MAG: hypothetical protein GY807_11525, partial [Gammaproteobacteria bacterium]|nr:hypothetical protein [Gammaproteobacteria bacterium]
RERARIIAGVIQSNGIFAHQLGGVQGDSRHQATPPIHPDTAGHTPHSEGPEASSRAATRDAGSEEPAHPPRTAEPEAEPPRTARGEAEPRRRQGESRPDALRAGTPPSVDMEVGPGRITATVEGCMFCVNPCGRLANFIERGLLRVIGLRRSTRRALRRIGRRATRIDESLSQRYVTRDYAEEKARELASEIDELARENGGDDALRDSLGEGNTQQLIEAIESAVRVPIVTEADVGSRLEPTSEPVPHTSATGEIAARDRRVDEAIAAYRQRPRARPNVPGDGIVAAGVLDLDGDQNRHLSENLFTGASPWALAQGDTHDATFVPRRSDTGTPVTNPQAINHAEQTVLGRAARALQTAFGDQATSITGQLRMSIERRSPCVNCMSGVQGQGVTNVGWRGPIVQFSERFPGIRLVITFPDPSAESGARTFTIRAGILDG